MVSSSISKVGIPLQRNYGTRILSKWLKNERLLFDEQEILLHVRIRFYAIHQSGRFGESDELGGVFFTR